MATASPRASFGYLPALDGLRGVAIAMVAGLHGHNMTEWILACCSGGAVGVDVFFVLSGFLITSLLLAERDRTGRIDLFRFYVRRGLRLLPALLLLMAFLTVCVKVLHLYVRFDRWIAAATLGYFANWVVALRTFDMGTMEHAWSLAVEEQFYLTWPPVLAVLLSRGFRRRGVLGVLLLGIGLVNLARVGRAFPDGPLGVLYHLGDSRADALLVGCGLAVLLRDPARVPPAPLRSALAGAGALVLVAHAIRPIAPDWFGRGGSLVLALATACVILGAVSPGAGALQRLLAWPPLVGLGRISYGLYLWHYPLILIGNRLLPGVPGRGYLALAASWMLAALSFRYLEQPLLRLKSRFAAGSTVAPGGGAC